MAGFNIPNPSSRLLQNVQAAYGISGLMEQDKAQKAAALQQQQVSTAVRNLNLKESPTAEDYAQVASMLPKDQADGIRSNWEMLSKDKQENQLRFAGQVLAAFNSSKAKMAEGVEDKDHIGIKMLKDRATAERNAGNEKEAKALETWASVAKINPDKAQNVISTMVAALPGGKEVIDSVSKLATSERGGVGASEKPFAPVTLVNAEGKKIPHIPTFDPKTGKARLEPADLPEGFELSKETATEKRQAEVAIAAKKKGAEVTGKGQAERRQVTINSGVESSEGLANLKRAKTLLDTVKTGGVDAASLRAKQIFGVEGADEGELSNRLGKAVLSQLKATFGAAFTAQEGASLARIEAGFGKSPKANKRLIDQLIKLVEKKGKQGIAAAVAAEDFEAAQLIKENMAFTLDIEPATTTPGSADIRSKADAILGGL